MKGNREGIQELEHSRTQGVENDAMRNSARDCWFFLVSDSLSSRVLEFLNPFTLASLLPRPDTADPRHPSV